MRIGLILNPRPLNARAPATANTTTNIRTKKLKLKTKKINPPKIGIKYIGKIAGILLLIFFGKVLIILFLEPCRDLTMSTGTGAAKILAIWTNKRSHPKYDYDSIYDVGCCREPSGK